MITLTFVPDLPWPTWRACLPDLATWDSGSRRMEAKASATQEPAMRTNTSKTASQTLKAHPLRSLCPAFSACRNHGRVSLTPASANLRFPARLANRSAESAFAVSEGTGQDVACPVLACLRRPHAGLAQERASDFCHPCLNFLDFSLPPPAGLPFPVHLTRLEGKRKTKDRAAFPTDSPGPPAGRCRSVKPFAR